ncbi:MAG: uncharacterized protein H6Q90_86 [Deltaproteobacteria bacterium]|nr:uncharacterized protein [Deltaproteobacteria bacterium]
MSHLRAIDPGSAIIQAMSRIALVASLLTAALAFGVVATSCTKSAANQEPSTKQAGDPPITQVDVPGGPKVDVPGGPKVDGVPVKGGNDSQFRLGPDEGKLAIEAPADAKAGSEATARILLTPSAKYKVNTEFPTRITFETTSGVTLAKAELKAGGHDQSKGDADQFDEKGLAFLVKLTPSTSGTYTINGSFKFAVCDKSGNQCLAKKEPIAIQIAAK